MKKLLGIASAILGLAACIIGAVAQTAPGAQVVQAWLTEPGSTPFYLQAVITESGDPNEHIDIEMSWMAPDKWRRTIRSQEFSQTLIANGDKAFEQDSDDYMPLPIQVLATAIVDPRSIVNAVRPGDTIVTKANGRSDESGKMCFDPGGRMCSISRSGLTESLRVWDTWKISTICCDFSCPYPQSPCRNVFAAEADGCRALPLQSWLNPLGCAPL